MVDFGNNRLTMYFGLLCIPYTFSSYAEMTNLIIEESSLWHELEKINPLSFVKTQIEKYVSLRSKLENLNRLDTNDESNEIRSKLHNSFREIQNFCDNSIFLERKSNLTEYLLSIKLFINSNQVYTHISNFSINKQLPFTNTAYGNLLLGAVNASFLDNHEQVKKSSDIHNQKSLFSKLIKQAESQLDDCQKFVSTFKQNMQSEFENSKTSFSNESKQFFDIKSNDFAEQRAAYEKKFADSHSAYVELLKLQAPAKYWDGLKTKYRRSGAGWSVGSTLCALLITAISIFCVNFFPDIIYSDGYVSLIGSETLSLSKFIKWGIITGLGLSVLIYLLRFFIKMALSAFHMARDAEERYTLTYLYLALIKEAKIDEHQTSIIFSSLFSRVDTGLLKGDSSPAIVSPISSIQNLTKL